MNWLANIVCLSISLWTRTKEHFIKTIREHFVWFSAYQFSYSWERHSDWLHQVKKNRSLWKLESTYRTTDCSKRMRCCLRQSQRDTVKLFLNTRNTVYTGYIIFHDYSKFLVENSNNSAFHSANDSYNDCKRRPKFLFTLQMHNIWLYIKVYTYTYIFIQYIYLYAF